MADSSRLTTSTTLDGLINNEVRASSSHESLGTATPANPAAADRDSEARYPGEQASEPPTQQPLSHSSNLKPLSSHQALVRLQEDIDKEISIMKEAFDSRSFLSWLMESISFRSELSKMRWPSVVFMTAQALAHFVVAFILNVENLATNWVGFQGFILTALLIFNLSVNLWDTKLRFKELLMKAEQIRDLVKRCAHDKLLLRKWRHFNWKSANAKTLFIPKSPCVHQTLTYRDDSCLNLPDFLLVRGDIIHLYPGERAPGDCVSLTTISRKQALISSKLDCSSGDDSITLKEGEIFHSFSSVASKKRASTVTIATDSAHRSDLNPDSYLRAHAKLKQARKGMNFLMLSTPYLKSLRVSLQQSHKRPVNSIEKECFIVSRKYFETYVIPMVFVLSTMVTAIHYGYLDLTDSDQEIKTISIAYLLLRPSLTIMPFLPWMFPCFWMAVNAYGSARLLCCAETQRCQPIRGSKSSARDWFVDQSPNSFGGKRMSSRQQHDSDQFKSPGGTSQFENLLATPTAAGSSDQNRHDDELHDFRNNIGFREIFKTFINLVYGRGGHVWRSSSLLQVLGCLTSLCCIDKVGILSWPNPTPEKVFVVVEGQDNVHGHHMARQRLTSSLDVAYNQETLKARDGGGDGADHHHHQHHHHQTFDVASSNGNDLIGNHHHHHQALSSRLSLPESYQHDDDHQAIEHPFNHAHKQQFFSSHPQGRPEVLDVSQAFSTYRGINEPISLHQSTRLQFDDPHWIKFLANLKPLGLAILMNNCCERSFGDYFRFIKHISYESLLRCNLSPVVKRRCLCDLARLIGFTRDSIKNYKYINQICAYKLVDPSSIKKGKLVSSLENSTRLKLPFPNMVCNIHQDTITGGYQVFSQGTADLILDSCVEYWNGKQLVPLDELTRKKIMDFYHRVSITSYCSAFAYSPLLKEHNLHEYYIEMPSEGSKCSVQLRKMVNEQYEEFLKTQVISIPPPSVLNAERTEPTENIRGVHFLDNHGPSHNTSSPSSSPILSSPDLNERHQFGRLHTPAQSKQSSGHHHVPRRHLSAEDLLVDISQSQNTHHKQDGRVDSKRSLKRQKLEEALDELTDQVFVGMVAMQYQACPDFVTLVEQLEHACIRFVHFSKENELRSRVFSEKMGLESGWNCHVSLQSDQALDKADKSEARILSLSSEHHDSVRLEMGDDNRNFELKSFCPPTRISDILVGFNWSDNPSAQLKETMDNNTTGAKRSSLCTSDDGTLYSWKSLPSLVMQIMSKVSNLSRNQRDKSSGQDSMLRANYGGEQLDSQSEREHEIDGKADGSESSAKDDEGFDTLAFDMSNRAKLPKGIENIRPHLETVDNIPLQVSLFTDCTTSLTKEMIEIMQDYGEIVCVIGSSSSRHNTPVFLQANASIAIEPLTPKSCTQNRPRGHGRQRQQRKRTSAPKTIRSQQQQQQQQEKPKKAKRQQNKEQTQLIVSESNMHRINNPRDRLGIGPSIFNEPGGQSNPNNKRNLAAIKSAHHDSSSSSSSPSSSSSCQSKLSQSLSESSSSSPSTSEDDSSSCSSNEERYEQQLKGNHESHDGDDDETMDEDGFAEGESADELENPADSLVHEFSEPSSLASKLASLPCSYNYSRKDQVHLYSLIMEARDFTFKMKNTFVCMICFALSISSAQFLASILFLPPMLSSGLTIWLTVVVVPLMSFSLMSTTMDSQVMKIAVGKNLQLKPENITFFVICYLIKFIPSIIVVVLNFGFIIAHSCKLTGFGSSSLGPCWMFTYVRHNSNSTGSKDKPGDEDLLWSSHLLTAQVCAAFLMVLYFGKSRSADKPLKDDHFCALTDQHLSCLAAQNADPKHLLRPSPHPISRHFVRIRAPISFDVAAEPDQEPRLGVYLADAHHRPAPLQPAGAANQPELVDTAVRVFGLVAVARVADIVHVAGAGHRHQSAGETGRDQGHDPAAAARSVRFQHEAWHEFAVLN
jgi:hypothetical protein